MTYNVFGGTLTHGHRSKKDRELWYCHFRPDWKHDCNCSDGKSILVIHGIRLVLQAALAGRRPAGHKAAACAKPLQTEAGESSQLTRVIISFIANRTCNTTFVWQMSFHLA